MLSIISVISAVTGHKHWEFDNKKQAGLWQYELKLYYIAATPTTLRLSLNYISVLIWGYTKSPTVSDLWNFFHKLDVLHVSQLTATKCSVSSEHTDTPPSTILLSQQIQTQASCINFAQYPMPSDTFSSCPIPLRTCSLFCLHHSRLADRCIIFSDCPTVRRLSNLSTQYFETWI